MGDPATWMGDGAERGPAPPFPSPLVVVAAPPLSESVTEVVLLPPPPLVPGAVILSLY